MLPDIAFWIILTFVIVSSLLTSIMLCWEPLSSKADALACVGVTYVLATFLVIIGTIYATLAIGDAAAACVFINIAGIMIGWPISHILSLPLRYALFTAYVVLFEVPYIRLVGKAARPEVRARFITMLRQLPKISKEFQQEQSYQVQSYQQIPVEEPSNDPIITLG